MPATPIRSIRVDDTLWTEFGVATEALGLDRAAVLVAFMRRFVAVMDPAETLRASDKPESPPRALLKK